jgi:hypothetical protein
LVQPFLAKVRSKLFGGSLASGVMAPWRMTSGSALLGIRPSSWNVKTWVPSGAL